MQNVKMGLNEGVEMTARICLAAVREYEKCLGKSQTPEWEDLDEHARASLSRYVYWCIEDTHVTPEGLHSKWYRGMIENGWTHGDTVDVNEKKHPNICPFEKATDQIKIVLRLIVSVTKAVIVRTDEKVILDSEQE